MFVFNDTDNIHIYNPSDNSVRNLTNVQDTILIDCSLADDRNENLRRFTLIHGCAHLILHRPYFSRCGNQLVLFEIDDLDNKSNAPFLAVINTVYNVNDPRTIQSNHDWIEWQENSLASYLLKNKSSLSNLLEDYNLEDCSFLQKAVIINQTSETMKFHMMPREYGSCLWQDKSTEDCSVKVHNLGNKKSLVSLPIIL